MDSSLRRQPIQQVVRDLIGDDGGPLLSHGQSEAEQRSFDATCRKLFRFLTAPEISRCPKCLQLYCGGEPIAPLTATNAEFSARRVAVKPPSRRAVRRQAQGLTAIRLAEAQLAVPSGEALPTQTRHRVAPLRCRCARLNVTPELPTVSAEEPDNEGPAKVADYLRNVGIALIIERQLAGTLLDGAALCSLNCHAIIALTLRHDRLDNFWFTLLHEIGHLKRNRPVRPAYRRGLPDGYVGRQAASR